MSNLVTNRCRKAVLKPTAKAVLMCLADRADDFGACWPSQKYICSWTCYGRSAVIAAVQTLEELGLIQVQRQKGRGNRTVINLAAVDEHVRQQSETSLISKLVHEEHSNPSSGRTSDVLAADNTGPQPTPKTSETSLNHKRDASTPKRVQTCISEDWRPCAKTLEWAAAERPDLDMANTTQVFRDHFLGTGESRADWDASFRKWVASERRSQESPKAVAAAAPSPGRDPALLKLDADVKRAAPLTPERRKRLKDLQLAIAAQAMQGGSSGLPPSRFLRGHKS